MKKSFFSLTLAVIMALSVSACSKEDTDDVSTDTIAKSVLISTSKVEVTDLPIWLTTVGQVHSRSAPTLAAEMEGRITMVAVDTGDEIEKGQLLAETDTSTLLLQKKAAQAGIERLIVHITNGERRVERFEKLSSRSLSSQTELDDAREQLEAFRADYKAAEAQLAIVDDSLAKSSIVAPDAGVVQLRLITAGDFVKRGQALFEITQPALLQARLPFPESLALRIKIGQAAKIYSPLTPGEYVPGEVSQLQPSIGLGSRAVMAIIDLDDPGKLRPRATLSGKVLVETRKQAVMVPNISIVRRPGGEVVYVINNGKAEARPVETGVYDSGRVEIVSGLNGNETVATDGAAFLTDGANVKLTEAIN